MSHVRGWAFSLALGVTSAAQSWQPVPVSSPPARENHAAAFDISHGQLVVFGGGMPLRDDTWLFDGAGWTQPSTPVAPSPRFAHAMAFDFVTARVILFGGATASSGGTVFGDTWAWDGTAWTQLQPATRPPARLAHAMVEDISTSSVLLFAGRDANGIHLDDTWRWDGSTWTQVALTGPAPPPRCCHDLAHDFVRGRTVLFGGWNGVDASDTWEFDGATWTLVTPITGAPSARWGHRMAYDVPSGRTVLHGGYLGGFSAETWTWDGTSWSLSAATGSVPRANEVLRADLLRNRLVTFGGSSPQGPMNNTATFGLTAPATVLAFGSACPGPSGSAALSMVGADLPWIGSVARFQATPVPVLGCFVFGWSNVVDGTTPLPAALAAIGMPGCDLLVSMELVQARVPTGSTIQFAFAIPYQPALVGQTFYCQAASFDPGANPLGLTVSNGLAATFGWL